MRVTGRPVTEPAGTAVGRLRTCGSSAVIASRIAGTGSRGPAAVSQGRFLRERKNPGDDLFSRKAALSVSSALESLTSVFGMGTGMASPPVSPGFLASGRRSAATARPRGRRGRRCFDLRSRSRQGPITIPATDPRSVAEEVKPSTVSTDQLHALRHFHLPPIKHVLSVRSYLVTQRVSSSRGRLPT